MKKRSSKNYFLWTQLLEGKEIIHLDENYDSELCYEFYGLDKKYSSYECQVEMDKRDSLVWKEYLWQKYLTGINQKRESIK